jgi:hypothetical protein
MPSTGSMCIHRQCQGISPNTAGTKATASSVPAQRSNADPLGRERIHVQPMPPSHSGNRKAVKPSDCSMRSLR